MDVSTTNIMEDSLEFDENLTPVKRSAVPSLDDVAEHPPGETIDEMNDSLLDKTLSNGIDVAADNVHLSGEAFGEQGNFYDEISTIGKENIEGMGEFDETLRQQHIEQLTANEIFTDGALDFLEKKGSGTPVESEVQRQSLFVKFDPMLGAVSTPVDGQSCNVIQETPPGSSSEFPGGVQSWNGLHLNGGYQPVSHTMSTNFIAAMQQKQQAMAKQLAASKMAEAKPRTPNERRPVVPESMLNGSGDHVLAEDISPALQNGPAEVREPVSDPGPPPGSLVSLNETPQRPVALRVKSTATKSATQQKMINRRSVPAAFLHSQFAAMDTDLQPKKEEFLELPEIAPVWENVIGTYESLVQTLIAKLQKFQEEANEAKLRESRAIKEQEEMHRVFVGLHERFEASKSVINTYKTNQETLQNAFDELNAEFQPLILENKKMQAAIKLHDMKVRQLELELEKRKEENAELTRIVDDLITKDA